MVLLQAVFTAILHRQINEGTYFATGGGGATRLPIGLTAAAGGTAGRWIPRPVGFLCEDGEGRSCPFLTLEGGVLFCLLS